MKREEILAAMRRCAEELGRTPSRAELVRMTEIRWHHIFQEFGGMRPLAREAGLAPVKRGLPADPAAMVLDWARVARELRRLPGRKTYDALGRNHSGTLHARLNWSQMPHRFVLLVREYHMEKEWGDVLAMVLTRYPLLGRSAPSSAAGIQPPVGAISSQHSAPVRALSSQHSAFSPET